MITFACAQSVDEFLFPSVELFLYTMEANEIFLFLSVERFFNAIEPNAFPFDY